MGLPFNTSLNIYRNIAPGATYTLGKNSVNWTQSAVGGSVGISYAINHPFDDATRHAGCTVARREAERAPCSFGR